ncbi:MAG TPA: nitroreductase/quinone reductase family protein [Acidimicrobiales bacterium]
MGPGSDAGTTPLRQLLARAVDDRRKDDAARLARVPAGVFSSFDRCAFVFLETRGRRTGLWRRKFWGVHAAWGDTLYLIEDAGASADWVRNVVAHPVVRIRACDETQLSEYRARLLSDPVEIELARELVYKRLNDAEWSAPNPAWVVVALDA